MRKVFTSMRMAPVYTMVVLAAGLIWGCAGSSSRIPAPPVPAPKTPPSPSSRPTPSPTTGDTQATRPGEGQGAGNNEGAQGTETVSASETKGEAEATARGARTGDEERAGLDSDLDESLREFDEILLREQEALEERHEATASAGTGTGRGRVRGTGTGDGTGLDGRERERAGEQAGLPGTGGSPDMPPQDEPGVEDGTGGPIVEPGTGDVPGDVGDGADDDIVARQLREAAMNEEDPELREKLWDEYRAYKAGLKK